MFLIALLENVWRSAFRPMALQPFSNACDPIRNHEEEEKRNKRTVQSLAPFVPLFPFVPFFFFISLTNLVAWV
jgi:hypothetical protein